MTKVTKQKINLTILLALAIFLCGCPPFDSSSTTVTDTKSEDSATVVIGGATHDIDLNFGNTLTINAITTNSNGTTKYIAVSQDPTIATVTEGGPVFTVTGLIVGVTTIIIIDNANGNALSGFSINVTNSGGEE